VVASIKPLRQCDSSCWPAAAGARGVEARAGAPRGAVLHRERITTMDGSKPEATSYSPVFQATTAELTAAVSGKSA